MNIYGMSKTLMSENEGLETKLELTDLKVGSFVRARAKNGALLASGLVYQLDLAHMNMTVANDTDFRAVDLEHSDVFSVDLDKEPVTS